MAKKQITAQEKDLQAVRAALRFIGAPVVERPIPAIIKDGERDYYRPSGHVIALHSQDRGTWLHELAHSQQADLSAPAYYRKDGSLDARLWMADRREQEARAVEIIAQLIDCEDWEEVSGFVASVAATVLEKRDWAEWIMTGEVTSQKPALIAGRQRRLANALKAQYLGKLAAQPKARAG